MELYTAIKIPKPPFRFSWQERILLLGSCFAENIGAKLAENKFNVDINPFGTLYNAASIAAALRMLLHPERFTEDDLFRHEGVYHSFTHHSRFSSTSETECLENINDRLFASAQEIRKTGYMVITLGTAYVYRLKSSGQVVANCHKLPEKMFDRSMLSVAEIVSEWKELLLSLWEQCPDAEDTFSPSVRYATGRTGHMAINSVRPLCYWQPIRSRWPIRARIAYFPAYEIMMDELRDYRFYATDMLHPSELAVDYIWQRFTENFLSDETKGFLKEWAEIQKAINHRPFQPESEAYKRFISQTLLKMERINEKFPSFDSTKEMEIIKSKLM